MYGLPSSGRTRCQSPSQVSRMRAPPSQIKSDDQAHLPLSSLKLIIKHISSQQAQPLGAVGGAATLDSTAAGPASLLSSSSSSFWGVILAFTKLDALAQQQQQQPQQHSRQPSALASLLARILHMLIMAAGITVVGLGAIYAASRISPFQLGYLLYTRSPLSGYMHRRDLERHASRPPHTNLAVTADRVTRIDATTWIRTIPYLADNYAYM